YECCETGSIDDVDLCSVPIAVCDRTLNTNFSGDFVFVVVGHRRAVVHASESLSGPRVKQHRRYKRSLARVAVTYNADVSDLLGTVDLHSGPSPFQRPVAGSLSRIDWRISL